jgi:hypothetical protein
MAVWALRELGEPAKFAEAKTVHLPREADDAVRGEWLAEQTL